MSQQLKVRLTLVYALVALVVFGLTAFGIHLSVMDKFETFAQQNRERRRGDFVRVVSSMLVENGTANLRGVSMAMRRFGIRDVCLRSTNGSILFEIKADNSSRSHNGMMNRSHRMNMHRAMDLRSPEERRPPADTRRWQTWNEDIIVDGRLLGQLCFVAMGEPRHFAMVEDIFMDEVLRTLVIATGLAILVFGGLSWSFARTIARPLELASEAAGRIAGGDLTTRLLPSGVREVSALADDFNGMADALALKEGLRMRMTSDIAHELRTPVSILKSHLEGIRDGILPADENEVSSLIEETARLERVINDLRAIWELENAGSLLRMVPLTLISSMESLADRFRSIAGGRGIEIQVTGDTALAVLADEVAFERAFTNLVSNAVKYGRDGGTIAISWTRRDTQAEIAVCDDGPGIPEDDIPHVFERFYRADAARARKDGGAGLGLAIAEEAIMACHGSIRVENNVQSGCTFFVRLPLADDI
jgi:two-component system sensor histidine kinase BaeS